MKKIFYTVLLVWNYSSFAQLEQQIEGKLWAELAFKHSTLLAIDALEKTNKALGLSNIDDPNKRKILTIRTALGAGILVYASKKAGDLAIKAVTPNDEKIKAYKNIVSKISNIKKEQVRLNKEKNKIKLLIEETRKKHQLLAKVHNKYNSTIKNKNLEIKKHTRNVQSSLGKVIEKHLRKETEKQKAFREKVKEKIIKIVKESEILKEATNINEQLLADANNRLKKETAKLTQLFKLNRPSLAYRIGRLARVAGLTAISLAGIGAYAFIATDVIYILIENDEQMQTIKQNFTEDVGQIAQYLDVHYLFGQ